MILKAPLPNEFEVSVFGPGYGEAALVHLGDGDWLVADSCVDQRTRAHPVLRYLERIEVDASKQVKRIVASHWHRDHVRGLSRLVEACSSADIFLSDAMKHDEIMEMTMSGASTLSAQSSLRELRASVDILKSRASEGTFPQSLHVAAAGTMIYRGRGSIRSSVEAVAPSTADVIATRLELTGMTKKDLMWKFAKRHPNDTSVVLWIEFGGIRVLLGADLEYRPDVSRGWGAVVAHYSENLTGLATILKVPHHGSITGHDDRMWDVMVDDGSHAAIAPYRPSKIPKPSDLERLVGLADRVHMTAKVETPKAPSVPQLSGHALKIEEPEGRSGQIRIRGGASDLPADFKVSRVAPAHEIDRGT